MSVTDAGCIYRRICDAISGADACRFRILLRILYAVCGTDTAYGCARSRPSGCGTAWYTPGSVVLRACYAVSSRGVRTRYGIVTRSVPYYALLAMRYLELK
eukprot:3794470-Rhodomonas_salina.3